MSNFTVMIIVGVIGIIVVSLIMAPRKSRLKKMYFKYYFKQNPANDLISVKVCDIIAAAYGESNDRIAKIKPSMKIHNVHFVLSGDKCECDEIVDVFTDIEMTYGIHLPYEGFNVKEMTVADVIVEVKNCLHGAN